MIAKWISVKEELPEEHTEVLVYADCGIGMAITFYDIRYGFYRYGEYVTHWTPLPKPPKGE